MSRNPASILFDSSGNEVAVILDNTIYRLETRGSLVGQDAGAGAEKKVSVLDDATSASTKRLQVEADIKPGAVIQVGSAIDELLIDPLTDGGSDNMVVDGSTTPVEFTFPADGTEDLILVELRLVMAAAEIQVSSAAFGKGGGILANGVGVETTVNDGNNIVLMSVFRNEDFFRLTEVVSNFSGTNDIVAGSLRFGGRTRLVAGSSDEVKVTINDDLTAGIRGIGYFNATLYYRKEV